MRRVGGGMKICWALSFFICHRRKGKPYALFTRKRARCVTTLRFARGANNSILFAKIQEGPAQKPGAARKITPQQARAISVLNNLFERTKEFASARSKV